MTEEPDSPRPERPLDEHVLQPRAAAGPLPRVSSATAANFALLRSGASRAELLERLSDGDPLGLYERAVRRARGDAFLIDPDRLFAQVLACVAQAPKPMRSTQDGDAGSSLDTWIDAQIDDAIGVLVSEDRESLLDGGELPSAQAHAFMTQAFGVAPSTGLAASVAFNGLQENARRAFVALFINSRSVPECLEAGLGSTEELKQYAQEALHALTNSDARPGSASLGGDA